MGRGDGNGPVAFQTTELGKEQADEGCAIGEFQALGLDVILAKLHLEKIVTQRHASLDGIGDIARKGSQQGVYGIERANLLVHGHKLPIVLFHLFLDVVLREAQL